MNSNKISNIKLRTGNQMIAEGAMRAGCKFLQVTQLHLLQVFIKV